ncbi:unnamed protein product [Mesocestoides corti]|uniref:glutathione transferase n=1 Tax=Mesocestoides corti TaxID=53468 RepID=A0A0R3UC56_MESCO|nr:unnamed protein product [Mesocestoides corti]
MKPILAYWDIRGLCEASRMLMHYVGEEFKDKRYKAGPGELFTLTDRYLAPTFDLSDWLSVKYSLGLDFPNLPYFIDGDVKLTQSSAILEYIADKHGMVSSCPKRRAILHMLQSEIMDLRSSFVGLCYNPDFENLKPGFLEKLPQKLEGFEKYLGEKHWLTGDKVTVIALSFYVFKNCRVVVT